MVRARPGAPHGPAPGAPIHSDRGWPSRSHPPPPNLLAEGKAIFNTAAVFGSNVTGSTALLPMCAIQGLQFAILALGIGGSFFTAYKIARGRSARRCGGLVGWRFDSATGLLLRPSRAYASVQIPDQVALPGAQVPQFVTALPLPQRTSNAVMSVLMKEPARSSLG